MGGGWDCDSTVLTSDCGRTNLPVGSGYVRTCREAPDAITSTSRGEEAVDTGRFGGYYAV